MTINRKLAVWLSFAAVMTLGLFLMWAKGETNHTYMGTVEWRYEVSAFHPNGDCARPSYWFDSNTLAGGEIHKRWLELGRPEALRVTFIGDFSRAGRWGHIGKYLRQIRAAKLIDASATARGCGGSQ